MRKQILAAGIFITSGSLSAQSQNLLVIPDTLSGTAFHLHIKDSVTNFYPSPVTSTMGINANYLGPTLFLNKGDSVQMYVYNELTDTTTLHWHGLHVNPVNDGGPHITIDPGAVWTPSFIVRDYAATYWYHPHLHMMTNLHATLGAAGIIIVRDSVESALALPRDYGTDDFPLVIQSKCFDSNKQIVIDNHSDSVMMVNGTLDPYLPVPAQVIRLRLLNASSERVYRLGMQNNITFYQIATDGGLLDAPVAMTRIQLSPGERAEILLDLTTYNGQILNLMNYGAEMASGIYGAAQPGMGPGQTANLIGYSSNVLNGTNFSILQLNVVSPTSNPVTGIPATLTTNTPYSPASANATKTLTFSSANNIVGPFQINGASFDMNVINYAIPKDNIEIWTLSNQTPIAHPFHIHDVHFYITDINGNPPSANMQGRKDVVLVMPMQTVTFITKFEDFCDDMMPYMYHCHMLPHEDDGMMGQFIVSCPVNGTDEIPEEETTVYPNPTTGLIHIKAGNSFNVVEVLDLSGRLVFNDDNKHLSAIDLTGFSNGIYVLRMATEDGIKIQKIVKQ